MTREEAIIELKKKITCTIGGLSKNEYNATVMAIEALSSDRPKGKWIDWLGGGNEWECSICKCSIESHGGIAYNYCPMCGARMESK